MSTLRTAHDRNDKDEDELDQDDWRPPRRRLPDVDQPGEGDEIPRAGLPTEDVELDTRPRR
jgi:hypothetical protein